MGKLLGRHSHFPTGRDVAVDLTVAYMVQIPIDVPLLRGKRLAYPCRVYRQIFPPLVAQRNVYQGRTGDRPVLGIC